jgi:hypothetical protein
VEFFVWELVWHFSGILLGQKPKERSSPLLKFWRVGVDRHSVSRLCVAGDYRLRSAIHPYNAKTAAAEGFHPLVVTKRWNLDSERAQGL